MDSENVIKRDLETLQTRYSDVPCHAWLMGGKTWDGHYVWTYHDESKFYVYTKGHLGLSPSSTSYTLDVVGQSYNPPENE